MTSDKIRLFVVATPLVLAALLITANAGIHAQSPADNVTQYRGAFAKETLTVSNSSIGLTSSVYAPTVTGSPASQTRADYAYVTVETDCIRYWPNAVAPTTTQGHKVCDSSAFTIWGYTNIRNLRMIRITTDATLQVSYYRFASNTP